MPFVLFAFQTEIVSSLLLSMLKQMFAEDRNDSVRATVIKSLALVMTIVESPSKYKEVLHYVSCLRFYFAKDSPCDNTVDVIYEYCQDYVVKKRIIADYALKAPVITRQQILFIFETL